MADYDNRIPFVKMHGAGNDYIYIIALQNAPDNLNGLARSISDRHFGVGADGLVVVLSSDVADFRMRMFNADGSEAQMCGNASRCIARLVYEKGLTDKTTITLETLAGIKTLRLHIKDGTVDSVAVDMGTPTLNPARIPVVSADGRPLTDAEIYALGNPYRITAVGMGNPHGVVFTDEITDSLVHTVGPVLETHPVWPEKANIEFAKVLSPTDIEMRVWERGSGETLACGTGACATAVAAATLGLTSRNVRIHLPGGTLKVDWNNDGTLTLTGPAAIVAEGIYYLQ